MQHVSLSDGVDLGNKKGKGMDFCSYQMLSNGRQNWLKRLVRQGNSKTNSVQQALHDPACLYRSKAF